MRRAAPFLPIAAAALVLGLVAVTAHLSPIARTIALGCLALAVVVAIVPRRADVRAHAAVALATASMTASGQAAKSPAFAVGCVVFVLSAIVALRGPGPPRAAHPASRRAAVWLGAVAVLVTGATVVSLPLLGEAIEQRIVRALSGRLADESVGFSSTLHLGSTRGMLESDRVVLRVYGERPEYLRGAVYDQYEVRYAGRSWSSTLDEPRTVTDARLAEDAARTRLVFARSAPVRRGRDARFFVPSGACAVGTPSGQVQVDGFGVLRPAPASGDREVWIAPGDCAPAVAPPRPEDVAIDPRLAARIAPIGAEWTDGLETERGRLEAIAARLRTFGYSLSVERTRGLDPVVDLLTVHREGHCEMFASAMVLLARARGVPARVVTGYRVSEENPLAGYAVVRERNAHAWVEAWVDGAWRTFDPTPPTELAARGRPGPLEDALDWASAAVDRALLAGARVGWVNLGLGFVAVGAAYLGLRRALEGIAKRRKARSEAPTARPLPCFVALESALAQAGHARAPSEPVERFAERLSALPDEWAADAARALVDYARLRYGGIGDEAAIAHEVEQAAARVKRAPAVTA